MLYKIIFIVKYLISDIVTKLFFTLQIFLFYRFKSTGTFFDFIRP